MRSLAFAPPLRTDGLARCVREMRFERRSFLPPSAACVVANGVRETLASLLSTPVTMRLCEPTVPDARAWDAIARDAILYRVSGSVADAAVVLRAADALALASAAFGEAFDGSSDARTLSPIEREVVERAVKAVAANLCAICGARDSFPLERVATIGGFVSFFEMLLQKPVEARIGVALSRDPAPECRGSLEFPHLQGVRVTAVASVDLGTNGAPALAWLREGAIVPIRAADLHRCSLTLAGRRVAGGTCGVNNGRLAMAAETARETA